MTEDAAGTNNDGVSGGRSWDKNFDVTNMRMYMGAKITDQITTTFNTEIYNDDGEDTVRLLDAFAEYTWSDKHHIRFGRHLPASDRYNLDGPYYQNSYDFPGPGISAYPFKQTGRVEGISYWGQLDGGKFKYQFSAAEGTETAGGPNDDPDNLMYTGRLTLCLWEAEPGYYNSSAFYGAKDVFTIGLVGVHQSDAAGTARKATDYNAWNIDVLLEKTYDWGTIDIEAAYFDYNDHQPTGTGTVGGAGDAWEVGLSYLYPEQVGWGKLQPITRYVSYSPDVESTTDTGHSTSFTRSKLELGMNYIIQPYNAKVSLVWANEHLGSAGEADWNEDQQTVKLGMQFQH